MGKFFGAELEIQECVGRREMIEIYQKAVNAAGFRAQVVEREGKDKWTLKRDHCGFEMTTPALPTTLANMKAINKWLQSMSHSLMVERKLKRKDIVYSETGLHIHVDAQRWTHNQKENVARAFIKYEPALFRVNDKCRQETDFSQPIRTYGLDGIGDNSDIDDGLGCLENVLSQATMEKIEKLIKEEGDVYHLSEVFQDHYSAMNFSGNWPTIECRHAIATMVPNDLEYWIGTLVLLTRAAKLQRSQIAISKSETREWNRVNTGALITFIRNTRFDESWMNQYKREVTGWLQRKGRSYQPNTGYRGEDY